MNESLNGPSKLTLISVAEHQKNVYNYFQSLLDSDVRSYTLWKELENTIPKGVFRRLRLPEPFPEQKKVESKRPKPYARPVPEAQKGVPLLNAEEQKQLEELNKTRATNAAVIAAAQKTAQEVCKMPKVRLARI